MTELPILARFTGAVAEALAPLTDAFDSPVGMAQFLAEIGWPVLAEELADVNAAFGAVPAAVTALADAAETLATGTGDLTGEATAVAEAVRAVTAAIGGLQLPSGASSLPAVMQTPAFWASLATDVVDYLIYRYLQRELPMLFAPLRAAGVLRREPATDGRVGDRMVVDWAELGRLFADPVSTLQNRYGWHGTLQHEQLVVALYEALVSLGQYVDMTVPGQAAGSYWTGTTRPPSQLSWTLWQALVVSGGQMAASKLDLVLAPIPAEGSHALPATGLVLAPELTGKLSGSLQISDTVSLSMSGSVTIDQAMQAVLRPGSARFVAGPDGTVTLDLAVKAKPSQPWQLLGGPGSSRIEIAEAHAGVGFALDGAGRPQLTVRAGTESATLVLEPGDLDSFLHHMLSGGTQRIPLAPTISWSNTGGFGFTGGSGLILDLPLGLSLADIVRIDSAHVELAGGGTGASLRLTLSATFALGPLTAHVDGIGVSVQLATAGSGAGNAGHAEVKLGFQPPTGMALALDAGLVSGGGLLAFDPEHGKYTGALALTVESIAVVAVGLLTTRNPDGSPILDQSGKPSFSLLILISATFPPIQLGFGFSLTGIGGLVGLNRGIAVDALRTGVRSGALESVLFPRDVVRNADSLVGQLNTLFPPAAGGLLLGPMVRLGWGTPAILDLELGVLLEFGTPLIAALVGRLRIGLPADGKLPIVRINLDAAGIINFTTGEISLDAALYDSVVAGFTLTGQMALRAGWRGDPGFALAIGGFHPAFSPPPGFPTLQRVAIALASGDNPMLRLSSYLAITSNTIQFGAALDLYAAAAGASISGHLGFDALITLSPFGFEVDIYGTVALRFAGELIAGVDLAIHLTGPHPWHAVGTASISLFIITVTVHFDLTVGSADQPPLPTPVNVANQLAAAIKTAANWSITPPPHESAVLFSAAPLPDGMLATHPLGGFRFTQNVVPLDIAIDNYGTAPVAGPNYFKVSSVSINGAPAQFTELTGEFAPAQYFRLDDATKLSRPSFEPRASGVAITLADADYDTLAGTDPASFDYELVIVDPSAPAATSSADGLPQALVPESLGPQPPESLVQEDRPRTIGTRPVPSPGPVPSPRPIPAPTPDGRPSVRVPFDAALAVKLSHSGPAARSAASRTSGRRFAEPALALAVLDKTGDAR